MQNATWLRRISGMAFVALPATMAAAIACSAAPLPEKLLPLLQSKSEIAEDLSKAVRNCVVRSDTDHVAFHGCVDWHSSVHGVWALIAYMHATGDKQYEPIVASILTPSNIEAERELLSSRPNFEMPYGRAWFLRLAIEYRHYYGTPALKSMADEVLESLIDYFRHCGIDVRSLEYSSASWALSNMYDYAQSEGNDAALGIIKDWINKNFARENASCDPAEERGTFMAVCTNWAWLASRVMPREQLAPWLDTLFARDRMPAPVSSPLNWHHYGLNFSRAWGLWEIYSATGEPKYADVYVAHFRQGYDDPQKWRGSYLGVGHWVPQFGMFALQGLFGSRGR